MAAKCQCSGYFITYLDRTQYVQVAGINGNRRSVVVEGLTDVLGTVTKSRLDQ